MLERPSVVHFVKTEPLTELVEAPDIFEYRPEKGWRWLQRLAIGVLRLVGARHEQAVTVWTRTAHENDTLLQSLLGQEGEFISRLYEREDMIIYLGPEEEPELMGLAHGLGMDVVSFSGRVRLASGRAWHWRDVPICVVPWMKGAVIVPRK